MTRWSRLVPLVLAAGALAGCNHPQPQPEEPASVDRVSQTPHAPPKLVVHGTFTLGKPKSFAFEVPPHVLRPRVTGEFSSSTQATGADSSAADVEFMIMTDAQYDDFIHGRSVQSFEAVEPTHNRAVSIALPLTQDDPVRYYVIFRRAGEGKNLIAVKAELQVEFDSPF